MLKDGSDLSDKVAKKRELFFAEAMSAFWFPFLTKISGSYDLLSIARLLCGFILRTFLVFLHVLPCFCCCGVKF